jgi:serine/threonine protein kinase
MVERGYLTAEQVVEALSGQRQEIRFCPRCRIHVNVFLRDDAVSYACIRCRGELVRPADASTLAAEEDVPLILTQEELPPEVERAKRHPESLFGKYVLVRELGRGGAGVIYLAWDSYLSQYVALKLLREDEVAGEDHSTRTRQLVREARNTVKLRHPGIVTVYDVGRVGRDFYISMEFLEGRTLEDLIDDSRKRGWRSPYFEDAPRTLRLLAGVARAVHHAHVQPHPIIHCDLKPGNVVVDKDGNPHVLDFGLARNLKLEKPGDGEITGTPSYMSPEQACGIADRVDHRTDVYSLGAILYELLTGRPTFTGEAIAILEKTVSEAPEAPSEVLKFSAKDADRPRWTVPPFLEELCMRCLDKEPSKRPATALEVSDLLDQAARALTPEGRRSPSTVILKPKASRRLKRVLVPALAALAALAAAVWWLRPQDPAARAADSAAEVRLRIGRFEPERALALAELAEPAARPALLAEAQAFSALSRAMADAVAKQKPAFREFRTRERTLREVRLDSAASSAWIGTAGSAPARIPWPDVEPSQVLDLARKLGIESDPALRRGLGLYARHSGRLADAREYFDSLPAGR